MLDEPLDDPDGLAEALSDWLKLWVLLSVGTSVALWDWLVVSDPLGVIDWLDDADADDDSVPVVDTETPWLIVCVADRVPLNVHPCVGLRVADRLAVSDPLGVAVALGVGSWVGDALSLSELDPLIDPLELAVCDWDEVELELGVMETLGEALAVDDGEELCDGDALAVSVAACDGV